MAEFQLEFDSVTGLLNLTADPGNPPDAPSVDGFSVAVTAGAADQNITFRPPAGFVFTEMIVDLARAETLDVEKGAVYPLSPGMTGPIPLFAFKAGGHVFSLSLESLTDQKAEFKNSNGNPVNGGAGVAFGIEFAMSGEIAGNPRRLRTRDPQIEDEKGTGGGLRVRDSCPIP